MTPREESGLGSLYDYNARFYSPVLGRFLSADTIVPDGANPQQFNRYAYGLNNPVKYTDPTGHKTTTGCEYEGCTGGWDEAANDATPEELIAATEAYYQFQKDPDHFLNLLLDPRTFWQHGDAQALANYASHMFGMQVEDMILSAYPPGTWDAVHAVQMERWPNDVRGDNLTTFVSAGVLGIIGGSNICGNCGTIMPDLARGTGSLQIDDDGASVYCATCLKNGATNATNGRYWIKSFEAYKAEALATNLGEPEYTGNPSNPGHFSVFKGGPTDRTSTLWQRLNNFVRNNFIGDKPYKKG